MRRRLAQIESRVLPRGWSDALLQLGLFFGVFALYVAVRGLFGSGSGYKPFGDADRIIALERSLHVFVEPSVQAWTQRRHWLMDLADWTYLNAHTFVTVGALTFIYLRRNASFYFVRNMFMIAMMIALLGYALYPTAPPRLYPEWGFTDSVAQFTGVRIEDGAGSAFLNAYAAVPSMHVCFALMTGVPMARFIRRPLLKALWLLYPLFIMFVVIATGNHYLTDVLLGALTAAFAALAAQRLLARVRPGTWAFGSAAA